MDDNIAGEPLLFSLLDKTPQTDLKIHCQAPSEEVKDNWTSQLRSILEMQGDFLRGQYSICSLLRQSHAYGDRYKQDAQLSQRDRAAGCVTVFAKSRRLELGDNILRTS